MRATIKKSLKCYDNKWFRINKKHQQGFKQLQIDAITILGYVFKSTQEINIKNRSKFAALKKLSSKTENLFNQLNKFYLFVKVV